ncbi:Fe-S oxidoreductase, partial [Sideroxydans sp. CL21]
EPPLRHAAVPPALRRRQPDHPGHAGLQLQPVQFLCHVSQQGLCRTPAACRVCRYPPCRRRLARCAARVSGRWRCARSPDRTPARHPARTGGSAASADARFLLCHARQHPAQVRRRTGPVARTQTEPALLRSRIRLRPRPEKDHQGRHATAHGRSAAQGTRQRHESLRHRHPRAGRHAAQRRTHRRHHRPAQQRARDLPFHAATVSGRKYRGRIPPQIRRAVRDAGRPGDIEGTGKTHQRPQPAATGHLPFQPCLQCAGARRKSAEGQGKTAAATARSDGRTSAAAAGLYARAL